MTSINEVPFTILGAILMDKSRRRSLIMSFGSQLWDATFAIQAILSRDLSEEYGPTLRKSHNFVNASRL
ncbi:hypothetical protein VNO77_27877 [Canavalia gladiata]|uniref:Uncharacterized protein n=1 Tax=Canavalia gladiata TaxID=3824 RepID=A0AAN9KVH3_CANGL